VQNNKGADGRVGSISSPGAQPATISEHALCGLDHHRMRASHQLAKLLVAHRVNPRE